MSGSVFKTYRTDSDAVEHGAWNDDYEADIRVRIRSSRSKPVMRAQEKVDERNAKYIRKGQTVPRDIQRKNQIQLAAAMVSDWSKSSDQSALPEDENGSPMPCTPENIAKTAEFDDWREQTIGFSIQGDNYRAAELEERAGNSAKSAAPSSAPAAPSETPAT